MNPLSPLLARYRTVGTATFAGCVAEIEAAFRDVPGVLETAVGHTGGSPFPAEVVRVDFEPARISYVQLLERFWGLCDRTEPAERAQRHSAILVHSSEQEAQALASRAARQRSVARPIVTEIVRAGRFFHAADARRPHSERDGRAVSYV